MARFLLVHGAMGGAWVWERVIPGLQAAGHTAEAIDLPGQGADQTPLAQITLYRYADAVCDALAAGPPAVLTGHSMGGMVVTQAAAQRPELVERLIYVSAFCPQPGQSRASQPVIPFTQPVELPDANAEAFGALPRAYISCLQDRAIRPPIQRSMYEAAGCEPVIEIDTDHSPWLSRPNELVDALLQIVAR